MRQAPVSRRPVMPRGTAAWLGGWAWGVGGGWPRAPGLALDSDAGCLPLKVARCGDANCADAQSHSVLLSLESESRRDGARQGRLSESPVGRRPGAGMARLGQDVGIGSEFGAASDPMAI